jgi:SOS-response transcriptional repressor LexA
MTPREKQCLDAIADLTIDGVGPTYQEIADRMGLKAKSGAHRLVESLEAQGLISRGPTLWRNHGARKISVVGHFDSATIARMSHSDLLALRSAIDRRLAA